MVQRVFSLVCFAFLFTFGFPTALSSFLSAFKRVHIDTGVGRCISLFAAPRRAFLLIKEMKSFFCRGSLQRRGQRTGW